jgi:hypothetical protein
LIGVLAIRITAILLFKKVGQLTLRGTLIFRLVVEVIDHVIILVDHHNVLIVNEVVIEIIEVLILLGPGTRI